MCVYEFDHSTVLSSQLKKHLSKVKSASALKDSDEKLTSDVEIKYKLHLIYLATQEPSQVSERVRVCIVTGDRNTSCFQAINILQSVPAKQRTAKSNMALGRLYQKAGMERPAVTCFREVLKACPLSLHAAQALMQLGVKAKEIQVGFSNNIPSANECLMD